MCLWRFFFFFLLMTGALPCVNMPASGCKGQPGHEVVLTPPRMSQQDLEKLVHALIFSQPDYFNSVF